MEPTTPPGERRRGVGAGAARQVVSGESLSVARHRPPGKVQVAFFVPLGPGRSEARRSIPPAVAAPPSWPAVHGACRRSERRGEARRRGGGRRRRGGRAPGVIFFGGGGGCFSGAG